MWDFVGEKKTHNHKNLIASGNGSMAATTTVTTIYRLDRKAEKVLRPLFLTTVPAGFPSPADDYIENQLDLNRYLIRHPAATFFVKVQGDSMIDAGIHSGDLLIVDRSLETADNRVVIAVINGELTVKRIRIQAGSIRLVPENPDYPETEVDGTTEFQIWGVVTSVIHPL